MDLKLLPLLTAFMVPFLLMAPVDASAQAAADDGLRWGVGFQSSWPSYGVSLQYDVSDQLVAQGMIGALGTLSSFGGRVLYRFQRDRVYDLYGYGALGMWRWGGGGAFTSETSVGVGGGAGIEFNWREIFTPDDQSFPPIFSSIELGVTIASFDHYNFNAFTFGGGIHYRF